MKSGHFNGDWNVPQFCDCIVKASKSPIQTIVFHPVWHTSDALLSDTDQQRKIATEITKKHHEMHREEFFENFFWLVKERNILKQNGHVVMPCHPRILAGLFKIFEGELDFLHFTDDIGVLSEVQDRWNSFVSEQDNTVRCGFDHNVWKLCGNEKFVSAVKDEAMMMNVDPEELRDDMQHFVVHENLSDSAKCIWMHAKDLHEKLKGKLLDIDDEEEVDLLGLTASEEEISSESLSENAVVEERNIMIGSVDQAKLKARAGKDGRNEITRDEFLETSIKVEATDEDCSEGEIDLVICLNGTEPIVMKEKEGDSVKKFRCRTVKLVERNDKDEEVCLECKWDGSKNKYSSPNNGGMILHTPVKVNPNKRKRSFILRDLFSKAAEEVGQSKNNQSR